MKSINFRNQLYIVLAGALLFIPFLGQVHLFDWDEINFAESAREMIVSGDYLSVQIFFEPFWEKPPLFIWLQVLSMKVFGINEFAARFPNAVCGIVTLLVLYNLGRRLHNVKFGIIWTVAYGCSILPFFYFKSGIIDPWFNLFIFLSIYYYVEAIDFEKTGKETGRILLSAAFLGLAVLTKGPVSVLVFGLVAFILLLSNGFRLGIKWWNIGVFLAALGFVGGFWFLLQIASGNAQVVADFIVYQIRLFQTKDAGHGGFPMYHFVILLFGMFPASVFAIQGHKYRGDKDIRKLQHIAMIILLWVVLLLFSIVRTKIVHYSSLTYFPVSYLAAFSVFKILEGDFKFRGWQKIMLSIIGGILALVVIVLPFIIMNANVFIDKGWITHSFTIGNLQADPGWHTGHSLIGLIPVLGLVGALVFFRGKFKLQAALFFTTTLLFVALAMVFITPGAEKISQRASIEFIKDKRGEDVYIHSFYKSFATLFYFRQPEPSHGKAFDRYWLAKGSIDKDVYFIIRIDKKNEVLKRYPEVSVLYEKNGYVFAVRKKVDVKQKEQK